MKTTILKLKYFLFASIAILALSCNPEDGTDGMDGAPGIQGEQGIAGQDGAAGQDGSDGQNGTNGENGTDGNANVISVLLEDQTISEGDTVFDVPQLTQEIYDTGLVYAYVTVTGNDYWEVLPLSIGQQIILEIDRIEVGRITLRSTFTQSNLRLRFVLVASTSSTTGKSSKQSTLKELEKMGINMKDYQQVASYFGLDH